MDQPDEMIIEFIGNGMIKVTTDKISGPNHMKAEEFLAALARGLGGQVTRTSKGSSKPHIHEHSHEHTHTHEH